MYENEHIVRNACILGAVLIGINMLKVTYEGRKKRQKIQEDLAKDLEAIQKTREQMFEQMRDPNYKLVDLEQLMIDMKFGFIVNRED